MACAVECGFVFLCAAKTEGVEAKSPSHAVCGIFSRRSLEADWFEGNNQEFSFSTVFR
jgi:hypothetical protein